MVTKEKGRDKEHMGPQRTKSKCVLKHIRRWTGSYCFVFLFFLFIYFRVGKGRREGEKPQCVDASRAPPGPQPRHVPGLGIKPATLCFTGRCSIHRVTPAMAVSFCLKYNIFIFRISQLDSVEVIPVWGPGGHMPSSLHRARSGC